MTKLGKCVDCGQEWDVALVSKCPACGADVHGNTEDVADQISFMIHFKMVLCPHCGENTQVTEALCRHCGHPFEDQPQEQDDLVMQRRKVLADFISRRDMLLEKLRAKPQPTLISGDEYMDALSNLISRFLEEMDTTRQAINGVDWSPIRIESLEFAEELQQAEENLARLVSFANESRSIRAPVEHRLLHQAFANAAETYAETVLRLFDALIAGTPAEANVEFEGFQTKSASALDRLSAISTISLAALRFRTGEVSAEAAMATASEEGELGLNDWEQIGLDLFSDSVKGNRESLMDSAGLLLAIYGLYAAATNNPEGTYSRAQAVKKLLGKADAADRAAIKEALGDSAHNILRQSPILFRKLDRICTALQQHPTDEHSADIGLELYQVSSETVLNDLINVVLVADLRARPTPKATSYSDIKGKKLGVRLNKENGNIGASPVPEVASLQSDLQIVLRNAQAHAKYQISDSGTIEFEDRGRSFSYTLEELEAAIADLEAAVVALATGIILFLVEEHAEYSEVLPQNVPEAILEDWMIMLAALRGVEVVALTQQEDGIHITFDCGKSLNAVTVLSTLHGAWLAHPGSRRIHADIRTGTIELEIELPTKWFVESKDLEERGLSLWGAFAELWWHLVRAAPPQTVWEDLPDPEKGLLRYLSSKVRDVEFLAAEKASDAGPAHGSFLRSSLADLNRIRTALQTLEGPMLQRGLPVDRLKAAIRHMRSYLKRRLDGLRRGKKYTADDRASRDLKRAGEILGALWAYLNA